MNRRFKLLASGTAAAILLVFALPLAAIEYGARNKIFTASDAPRGYGVALVFGAAAHSDIFRDRLRTAADLYFLGKAERIIVSGDGSQTDYDEPQAGADFLAQIGVPTEIIERDSGGLRTLDSCARTDLSQAYLVTQRYHLPRALYLCQQFGVNAIGVDAARQRYRKDVWFALRERMAQVWGWWEVVFT